MKKVGRTGSDDCTGSSAVVYNRTKQNVSGCDRKLLVLATKRLYSRTCGGFAGSNSALNVW